MPDAYTPTTDVGMVRLLCNDTNPDDYLLSDDEITALLTLEGNSVKLAAAQAIDTIADNEALLGKVIRDQDLQTDGAKVAAELRKRAAALRAQVTTELEQADDAGYYEAIPLNGVGLDGWIESW